VPAARTTEGLCDAAADLMLPNLLIIGGMKCGTTSLHKYLAAHPEVFMSEEKELDFFTSWNRRDRGLSWYEAQFPVDAPVRGESSPIYSAWPHVLGVPEAIAETLPEVKLIYLVRDPVDRVVSHYLHLFGRGNETRELAEVVADENFEESRYLAQSRYAMQLERYLEVFDRGDILVIEQEALEHDRAQTVRKVFNFLGVDESFSSPLFHRRYNVARDERRSRRASDRIRTVVGPERFDAVASRVPHVARRALDRSLWRKIDPPRLPAPEHERLVEMLAPDTARLVELTGLEPTGWSTWREPVARRHDPSK
jgi:hypothetical protein